MTDSRHSHPLNPDPPYPAGAPQPPDLDVDPEQFLDDDERDERKVPENQDVTHDSATSEPPD